MPGQLLDVLASNARTALDDPGGLPDEEWLKLSATPRWQGTLGLNPALVGYAIERLDEIINLLNPAEQTLESFAATAEILGRHLAALEDELHATALTAAESGGEEDAEQMRHAANRIHVALDHLDLAIGVLGPGAEVPPVV